MKDEILQELWKAKDTIAARHNHDVTALATALRAREKNSKAKVVNLHARRAAALRPTA